MATARNAVTRGTLSGDETVLRRLGSPWIVEAEKPKATRRASAKKKSDE